MQIVTFCHSHYPSHTPYSLLMNGYRNSRKRLHVLGGLWPLTLGIRWVNTISRLKIKVFAFGISKLPRDLKATCIFVWTPQCHAGCLRQGRWRKSIGHSLLLRGSGDQIVGSGGQSTARELPRKLLDDRNGFQHQCKYAYISIRNCSFVLVKLVWISDSL